MSKQNRSFYHDDKGMELPINIVVMLVVGMVALAALLAIIPESKKNLVVEVDSVDGNPGVTGDIANGVPTDVTVILTLYDRDNNPVEGASVIITGGGGLGSAKTDASGKSTVTISDVFIRINQDSIDLKLVAKANGFYDYTDESAILIT
ncbi:MAG: Ig-like domain-containing protein [ANME-2 cluster archaeon]|nr:Ig-like domain-containing protein [ANME-2 cluster archaeon]MDF1557602.1 Ig-like domain-containing protein [ANME-2 cluster archaeon]